MAYTSIYGYLKSQIQTKYNLLRFHESDEEVSAISIIDIFDESGKRQFENSHIMAIVEAIRRLPSKKKKYNVEIIGHEIIEGITIPDMQKHIPVENLPWT